MLRNPDINNPEVPRTARSGVRLPQSFTPARLFQGWGPELGR